VRKARITRRQDTIEVMVSPPRKNWTKARGESLVQGGEKIQILWPQVTASEGSESRRSVPKRQGARGCKQISGIRTPVNHSKKKVKLRLAGKGGRGGGEHAPFGILGSRKKRNKRQVLGSKLVSGGRRVRSESEVQKLIQAHSAIK